MASGVTYQALERLTRMPDDTGNVGDRIAGQKYYDVYITGGTITGIEAEFTEINNTPIGNITPSTGAFTTLSQNGHAITLGGALTVSGAFATTLTVSGVTTLTLPASGTLVTDTSTSTLTNKTLTLPVISSIVNTGTLTLPISTDTLVGRATTDTLTNKTLTAPVIATIVNSGTLTLPTSTDTLVGRATTDTLTNKTLTLPVIASVSNGGTVVIPSGADTLLAATSTATVTNKVMISPLSVTGTATATNNATLADITGTTVNLAAGATYAVQTSFYATCGATGGVKIGTAGTATYTKYNLYGNGDNNGFITATPQTALGVYVQAAGATYYFYSHNGLLIVANAGTLKLQWAQSVSDGTASILQSVNMILTRIS